jgi:cellulose synthase/poly-beta-1,6-N-acetylglucosamine synthase-like glycosyltransferase
VIGSQVNRYPQLLRRIVAEGHEVGVHTFTHPDLASVPPWRQRLEVTLTADAIADATGHAVRLLRPPYSSTPAAVTTGEFAAMRTVASMGYLVVLADRDTQDWRRPGVDAIVRSAMTGGSSSPVVMLHDGGGDRSQTVAATRRLLTEWRGVRFVSAAEGLELPAAGPAGRAAEARGVAVRWWQLTAGWTANLMGWLLVLAAALALLRLTLQVIAARVHARRAVVSRHRRYLGPVTVVVPAYNEAANIAKTVRSLAFNDYPVVEIIVVDDGSTDATASIVRGLRLPGVRVIRQPNAGKPAALNTGIAAARTELLVLVDGDTVFEQGAIGHLVQPFTDPAVGAISGNTKVANRGGILGRWQHLEYVMGFNFDRRLFDLGRCMPTVPGAIGAFRRTALSRIGGVPADTLAEDTDLTMALLRDGWRAVYTDRATAWTEAPSTLRQLWRQRYRWCYGTMQSMWKHRRAMIERGAGGRLGRRGLLYLALFQVLLPLAAPALDVYALYGLAVLSLTKVVTVWVGFTAIQVISAWYALRLDHERLTPLWVVPLQQILYRQLLYLVVVQSAVAALLGGRQRWAPMARYGLEESSVGVAAVSGR